MPDKYRIAAALAFFGVLDLVMGHLHAIFEDLSGKWKVIAIGMAPVVLIAVAILVTTFKEWRARSWIGVPGKIVSSKSVRRNVARSISSSNDEDYEVRNFAEISYTYKVGTQTLQGSRLGIGADLGNSEVAEKLARYRTGSAVTVYYNPVDPSEAVLERDLPVEALRYGLLIVAGLTAAIFAVVYGAEALMGILGRELPIPSRAPIVTALTIFASALALFALALSRMAASVGGWARTTGEIVGSEAETFSAGRPHMSSPQSKLIRQRVTYRYNVAGTDYSSDRVSMGARTSSSLRMLEQSLVRRYPVGAKVTVYFDPTNPSQAVLERGARLIWLIWASAALFAAAAVYLSGFLG